MYTMVATRPDLAFPLSLLEQFAAAPTSLHMTIAVGVLSYVKATLDYKLFYHPLDQREVTVQGYSNSNYAESPFCKSTTGFCFGAQSYKYAGTPQKYIQLIKIYLKIINQ